MQTTEDFLKLFNFNKECIILYSSSVLPEVAHKAASTLINTFPYITYSVSPLGMEARFVVSKVDNDDYRTNAAMVACKGENLVYTTEQGEFVCLYKPKFIPGIWIEGSHVRLVSNMGTKLVRKYPCSTAKITIDGVQLDGKSFTFEEFAALPE